MSKAADKPWKYFTSQKLRSNIADLFGQQGLCWLEELPTLIQEIEGKWDIKVLEPFDPLSYHFVAPARMGDGAPVVLKLGMPTEQFAQEASCLTRYQARGAARLLKYDQSLGALLLEWVQPGGSLLGVEEPEAIDAVVGVMERLHQASVEQLSLPTVRDLGQGFSRLRNKFIGETGPLPDEVVIAAEDIFWALESSMDAPVLLHGDLHHENILSSYREGWLAIDPQGVLGEPCYELGAYLRNPIPAIYALPDLSAELERRVTLLSEATGFDGDRIIGWGFSQAVLSAIWSIEDHGGGWQGAIKVAQALRSIFFRRGGKLL